jgi:hypothetical protein
MNIAQASTFFSGSILVMCGFIVVCIGIIVINNLFHKYWKPIPLFKMPDYRFVTEEELKAVEPIVETVKPKAK